MDPILLILMALTSGSKTVDELLAIVQKNTRAYSARNDLLHDLEILSRPHPQNGLTHPAIRTKGDDRVELTTEGYVWLTDHRVVCFIMDSMQALQAYGLPRD